MPERKAKSITYELLAQKAPQEEITFTAVIEKVSSQRLQSGKTVDVLEYVNQNGEVKQAKVWDKRIAVALKERVGSAMDLRFKKSDRGFWNLALTQEDLATAPEPATVTSPEPPKSTETAITRPSNHPLRESLQNKLSISPDVALAKAVAIVTHFSQVLQPKDQAEILDQVVTFYNAFLNINQGGNRDVS